MHTHVRNTINAIIIVCGTARSVCIIVYVAAKGLMNGNELSVQQVTHCLPAMFNR